MTSSTAPQESAALADALRHGIALFNGGRYYEAHEALEDAWRACSPGDDKRFLQGLTQAAVALHHYSVGNLVGAKSVLARAIRNASARATCCGVDGVALLAELTRCASALAAAEEFAPPRVVLDQQRSC
jgi:predicted metal-dependent hydrolase